MSIHSARQALNPTAIQRDFYRPHEVAQRLGLSREQVLRHLRSKKIPGVKLGRAWLVPAAELQRILSIQEKFSADPCDHE